MNDYDLRVSMLLPVGEASDFYTNIEVTIVLGDEVVGKIDAQLFHVRQMAEYGRHPFEAFDSVSGQTCEAYEELDKRKMLFAYDTILYISEVFVEKAHRGHSLGRDACIRLFQALGNSQTLAVLLPRPSELRGEKQDTPEAWKHAERQLRKYWRGVGFRALGRSNHYIMPGTMIEVIDTFLEPLSTS